jgi:hypothetical protein
LPVTIAPISTALAITENQVLSGAGTVAQYIRGDGSLADFPESSGGGSSVSYYLNGSVNQGTIGGVAYKELNKVPILGAGTDFSINADGYIASFITDFGDPNLLEIPGGNWNFETYFSASSSGGTPTFYVELYKVSGTTATLIASSVTSPEFIAFGTTLTPYFSSLAVPTTTLALTDRLAVRYYVTHSGRTITMHTENNHLCQIITTFTTGLTALNGLTTQVQFFAVGTSGTDFNIASSVDTHTFNLPTASATNRGALSSADWSTFNNKQNAGNYVTIDTGQTISGAKTFTTATRFDAYIRLKHDIYLDHISGYSTIGSDANNFFLAASSSKYAVLNVGNLTSQQTYTLPNASGTIALVGGAGVGTVTSVAALTLGTSGTDLNSTVANSTTTPVITLNVPTASATNRGALSAADWTTFNNKQNALTNPVTGTGTTNYLAKFTGTSTIGNSLVFDNGTNIGIGTTTPSVFALVEATGQFRVSNNSVQGFYQARTSDTAGAGVFGGNSFVLRNGATSEDLCFDVFNRSTSVWYTPVTIKNTGNLLVGTTTDNGARLHVSGRAYINNVGGSVAGTTIYGNDQANVRLRLENVSGRTWELTGGLTGANNSDFTIYDVTAAATRLTITSTGAATFSTTSGNGITIVTNDVTTLKMNSTSGVTKNWGFATTNLAASDFGIYQSTSNGGDAISAGTPRLYFSGGGNLLVGTTTDAGYKLDVNGTGRFSGALTATTATLSGSGADRLIMTRTSFGTYHLSISSTNRFSIYDPTADAERISITSAGNVGIGTTSPAVKLDVIGEIRSTSTSGYGAMVSISALNLTILADTHTNGNLTFWTAGSEKSRVTSTGNLLVGTTTDNGARLQIEGGATEILSVGTSSQKLFFRPDSAGVMISTATAQGGEGIYFGNASDFMYFQTANTERMRITSGGNVLIGTATSGASKLRIVGLPTSSAGLSSGDVYNDSGTLKIA